MDSINKISFKGKLVAYLPNSPKLITGDGDLQKAKRTDESRVFNFQEKPYKDNWKKCFWFDKGDPFGTWKYEIYIDGN